MKEFSLLFLHSIVMFFRSTIIAMKYLSITLYPDYWAEFLKLDPKEKKRLELYRLFYIVAFMSKHMAATTNTKKNDFNVSRLQEMYQRSLSRFLFFSKDD